MAAATVRVHGLKELNRALARLDKKARKELGDELKTAAEPVVKTARSEIGVFRGASLGTIRARRSGLNIAVEQSKSKVTGQRGDFGALQMRRLISSLAQNEGEIVRRVEVVLNQWGREEGF